MFLLKSFPKKVKITKNKIFYLDKFGLMEILGGFSNGEFFSFSK